MNGKQQINSMENQTNLKYMPEVHRISDGMLGHDLHGATGVKKILWEDGSRVLLADVTSDIEFGKK